MLTVSVAAQAAGAMVSWPRTGSKEEAVQVASDAPRTPHGELSTTSGPVTSPPPLMLVRRSLKSREHCSSSRSPLRQRGPWSLGLLQEVEGAFEEEKGQKKQTITPL